MGKAESSYKFTEEYIEKLNGDIAEFPQVSQITEGMEMSFSGVQQLVMLDRYAFKDTEKKTLTVGDFVVLTVKDDPKFPARGFGYVTDIDTDAQEVIVSIDEQFHAVAGAETVKRAISAIDKPLELYYEQVARRNARGLATVEETAEKRDEWERRFYEELVALNFVPAGRVLYGAGADTDVTFFNCLGGETIVQTKQGPKEIRDLNGEVEVLSMDGKYRTATFKSYGEQELFEVTFSNGEKVRATAGHEWFYNSKGGLKKTTTLGLAGKRIPIEVKSNELDESELQLGIIHGIVYGDGTIQHGEANVKLFGNKIELVRFFKGSKIVPHYGGDYVGVYGLDPILKELPTNVTESYYHGFIQGLIASDGYVDDNGSFGLHSSSLVDLTEISNNLYKTNFSYSSIKMTRKLSPFNGTYSPVYKLQFIKQTAKPSDFLRSEHRKNFENSAVSKRKASIEVVSVVPTGDIDTVYCCEEPETNSFVIGTGYLTGNCYVMPFPKDSREGIAEHRGEVMEIMSRGGGVGTNGSTLRPRNALARGVNGKSSGAVSWLNDIAQLTHLVEQGGSRRGAQMIMLADWHPDIIEFIISKMQNPRILRFIIENTEDEQIKQLAQEKLKFTPLSESERINLQSAITLYESAQSEGLTVKVSATEAYKEAKQRLSDGGTYSVHNPEFLTGANISVALTREFMQAVEDDADYTLRFPDIENYSEEEMERYNEEWHEVGDVREWEALGFSVKTYRTIKARELWRLINICATYSAEPGVFFIDNANDMTNAVAYEQKVIATNPCGEQPLAPYSVCNLAAINLASMVNKDLKMVDFEKLRDTVHVGVRMQDNVIDATPYFLIENEIQAKGERRVGLGVMGLADMLIYCEKVYGSVEGNELVDKVFETIATEAYRASIELAKEKGSFPFLDHSNLFVNSGYMERMPEDIRADVVKHGIRNSHLLTVAPTGSTGTMVGVSTGLEPYFAFKYYRSGRLGKFIEVNADIVNEYYERYYAENPEADRDVKPPLPPWFVSAMELSPEAHVDVQCIIQRWVDSSLSKTVNAPKGYSVERVQSVYERLYKGGAKGGTVYVDGSRDAQVLALKAEESDIAKETEGTAASASKPLIVDTLMDVKATKVTVGNELGDTCPICREGTIIESGGCHTCGSCGMQLKCGV